jgi:hypothetical protein
MKQFRWKWFLPLAQLVFASFCLVYGPYQYKGGIVRDHAWGTTLEYFSQRYPPPVKRISYGINFPALVLDYPLWGNHKTLYEWKNNYTFIEITPEEIGFLVGIAVFWYWVGKKLDQNQIHGLITARPRKVRIAGLACGLAFGVLTGGYAVQMIVRDWHWRPERQIGAFGIAWSCALIAYFAWQFTREFRPAS